MRRDEASLPAGARVTPASNPRETAASNPRVLAASNPRVLVASNRGPLSFTLQPDGAVIARRGGGGLVSGLLPGLESVAEHADVLWVCAALSDADRVAARRGPDETELGGVGTRTLDIPEDTFRRAYNSVANATLWFVHHLLFETPVRPSFGSAFRRDWDGYVRYNETFATALAESAATEPGATRVLVQDYHLTLVPRMLRDLAPGARVAHFSHTPWAPPDYYRILPDDVGRAILDGILGADHAGFLCRRWADAFLDCCQALLGARVDRTAGGPDGPAGSVAGAPDGAERMSGGTDQVSGGTERGVRRTDGVVGRVHHRGQVTEVAVHPLGVDVAALRERAHAEDVEAQVAALAAATGGRKVIARVDRTELSKNILRGLAAYRELLTAHPQWRGRVVHVAFAYPSRTGVPGYREYTDAVRRAAAEITAEFGTADWDPLILEVRDDYTRSLAACRLADVLVVNPIRDGMNLVAEEGPVLSDRGCALVLSREAGAADLLGHDALLVNPYDVAGTADALHRALAMPDAQRRRRCAALAEAAASQPPGRWLADQLAALG